MGKNIVVLSDGTGNSAAKANKTNIWRLYQALDKSKPAEQAVLYDDGVGTTGGFVKGVLGGALGFGLRRNVVELYDFLSRAYEPGDRIYLFGFSRGAYTVRTLAAMVARQGLERPSGDVTGTDSRADANRKYADYRGMYNARIYVRLWRRVFGAPAKPKPKEHGIKIEFMGVWDSVDAYGLPSDEFAELWHNWVYPIYFPDRDLSPIVQRACQALAIDDERQTFHPLLWNEAGEAEAAPGEERIQQVWFSGMHSDVGGGYFRSGLAHVSLMWMIKQIGRTNGGAGLKFVQDDIDRMEAEANPHGEMHDSRAGKSAFYRYRPRAIEELCNDTYDPDNKVVIKTPKIHASVFERIAGTQAPYAPLGLPKTYDVVTTTGNPAPDYESDERRVGRVADAVAVYDIVYWRRWLYLALMGFAAVVALAPAYLPVDPDFACGGVECLVGYLLDSVEGFVPAYLHRWLQVFIQYPIWLAGGVLVGLMLWTLRGRASLATERRATHAWRRLKNPAAGGADSNSDALDAQETRTSRLRNLFSVNQRKRLAKVRAHVIGALVLFVALPIAIDRIVWEARDISGWICAPRDDATPPADGGSAITFDAREPCLATGILLKRGVSYRISVAPPSPSALVGRLDTAAGRPARMFDWSDGPYPAGPAGFDRVEDERGLFMRIATPFRRHWSERWFKLMGRVGHDGEETFPIGVGPAVIEPKRDGELFLYVNDATFGVGFFELWSLPYRWESGENAGKARITVEAK